MNPRTLVTVDSSLLELWVGIDIMIESKREHPPNKAQPNNSQIAPIHLADTCDECGKNALEVKELIIGNGECICNECLPKTEKPLFVAYRDGELQ